MTAFRLALTELRRMTTGTLPKLAVLALAVIPTLYAGLYLFANFDPYGNLDEVPAALVVQDEGTTTTDAATGKKEERDFGRDVADQLLDDGGFGWVETTQHDAELGVRDGRYDAALVIGPEFSADLVSAGELEPEQASLSLVTNDANNYLAKTIADTIVDQVRDSIASQVGTEAADTFLRGFGSIHANLADAVDGADELLGGTKQLRTGVGEADDGAHELADGAAQAADGAATLDDEVGPLADAVGQLDDGARQLDDGAGTLAGGLGTLRDKTADLPDQTQRLADGARQVADGNAQVAQYGDQAAQAAGQVLPTLDGARSDAAAALDQGRSDVDAQLADLCASIADSDAGGDLAARCDTLHDDVLGRLDSTRDDVDAALDAQRQDVTTAVDEVEGATARLDELADGSQEVADGASALASATPQLSAGIASAADGANRLSDGAGRLADGTGQLAASTPALVDGVGRLADGTGQVSDGAGQLADGTTELRAGAEDLVGGTGRLRDGLADGLGQVPNPDDETREDTAATIGNPVEVENQALSSAGTYGGGLAPFFLSLATWIGAYVLFLLVKPLSSRALAAGRAALQPFHVAFGGWAAPAAIGVLQVAAMFTVTKFALDIQPAYPVATALFMVLVSGTFIAIVQLLNVWLGAAGQFLGLVLMLVQLVTAGGTFPWQTIPEPLRALHHVLPMSYAVEGLRQLLYGGNVATVWRDVAVLVGVLAVMLALTTHLARRRRVWTPTRLQPELVL